MKTSSCSPVDALMHALQTDTLGHALMLSGDCVHTLLAQLIPIAERLLDASALQQHPDCFILRPLNKMRQISVDATRQLIHDVQQTPMQSNRKVAIVLEPERFHPSAAHAFLKTLEEPPLDTTIFLVTTALYQVLPTLRSRCEIFRFQHQDQSSLSAEWSVWLQDYRIWLTHISQKPKSIQDVATSVMYFYRLIYNFELTLDQLNTQPHIFSPSIFSDQHLSDEEQEAAQAGAKKALRRRLFQDIALATREHSLSGNHEAHRRIAYIQAITWLESKIGLLEVNLNEATFLESYFIRLIRLLSQ